MIPAMLRTFQLGKVFYIQQSLPYNALYFALGKLSCIGPTLLLWNMRLSLDN